jgi:hypothetical protein
MTNPGDNDAPVDPVNRPAFGYTLNLLCFCLLFKFYLSFNLNTCTCFTLTRSLITVMNLLIISGIKMYWKLPIYLTVHFIWSLGNPAAPKMEYPSNEHLMNHMATTQSSSTKYSIKSLFVGVDLLRYKTSKEHKVRWQDKQVRWKYLVFKLIALLESATKIMLGWNVKWTVHIRNTMPHMYRLHIWVACRSYICTFSFANSIIPPLKERVILEIIRQIIMEVK